MSTRQDPVPGEIVSAAIHPAIGIARVGNSEDTYFIGPEVIEPPPQAPRFYRDPTGALKRQAARFRIYGLDALGQTVCELTSTEAEIAWTVHLANKKAAWFQFQLAQDIPEAAAAPASLRRNASVSDRASLVIDPGPRTVFGGVAAKQSAAIFDTGSFMGASVYLGELHCDEAGRLIVLGGRGKSASPAGDVAITFANNEGWYDDTSDGPVTATLKYQGRDLAVTPAWVVVAPPNYAPSQKSVRTMWDLMRDLAIKDKKLSVPNIPSFEYDIRPILTRLSKLQWVNEGFAGAFGWGTDHDFEDPDRLARLSDSGPASADLRASVAGNFRRFERDAWSPVPWPWNYGDAMNVPTPQTPRAFTALTDTQLSMLNQWAQGDFVADYDPARRAARRIEDIPVPAQPPMLDRAALEFCLADAFHPGCEMTWPMRMKTLYIAPFRIAHAAADWKEPDYGPLFTADLLGSPIFDGQVPGGITRWMAVPWQTDTASCRGGYKETYGPYLPTFWPARVPNEALTETQYAIVMDPKRSLEERMTAFVMRADWNAPLNVRGGYVAQINGLVADIGQMGVVERRDGPRDTSRFPTAIEVQDLSTALPTATASEGQKVEFASIAKVRRFVRHDFANRL